MHHRHVSVRWQLAVLGTLLCLLAALFAVEAKVAWYWPAHSPTAQISSAKLQPADAPKALAQSHLPSFPSALILEVAAVLALFIMGHGATFTPAPPRRLLVPGSPGYFPILFFRPPPGF